MTAIVQGFRIQKEVSISASHQLEGMRPGHKCARMHGHNYRITVTLAGSVLDTAGMLFDYDVIEDVCTKFDHQHLNDMLKPLNPTAENFARLIFDTLSKIILDQDDQDAVEVVSVSVSEDDTSTAEVFLMPATPAPADRTAEGTDWEQGG